MDGLYPSNGGIGWLFVPKMHAAICGSVVSLGELQRQIAWALHSGTVVSLLDACRDWFDTPETPSGPIGAWCGASVSVGTVPEGLVVELHLLSPMSCLSRVNHHPVLCRVRHTSWRRSMGGRCQDSELVLHLRAAALHRFSRHRDGRPRADAGGARARAGQHPSSRSQCPAGRGPGPAGG